MEAPRGTVVLQLVDDESEERGACEQDANNDGRVEEVFLEATARMICRAEVISAKCATQRRPRLLQEHGDNKHNRKHYLYVGQYARYRH